MNDDQNVAIKRQKHTEKTTGFKDINPQMGKQQPISKLLKFCWLKGYKRKKRNEKKLQFWS